MQNSELIYTSERLNEMQCEEPVLEIGAGWNHEFHRQPFRKAGYVEFFTQDVTDYGDTKQDFLGDICQQTDIPANFAGVTLLFNVLEHVYAPWRAVDEVWRILKSNGVIIGSVPLRAAIHRWDKDFWRFCPDGIAYLFRRYRLTHLALDGNVALPANILFTCVKQDRQDWETENQEVALRPEVILGTDYVTPSLWKQAILNLLRRRFGLTLDPWYGPWAAKQMRAMGFKSWTVRDYGKLAIAYRLDLHRQSDAGAG